MSEQIAPTKTPGIDYDSSYYDTKSHSEKFYFLNIYVDAVAPRFVGISSRLGVRYPHFRGTPHLGFQKDLHDEVAGALPSAPQDPPSTCAWGQDNVSSRANSGN